MPKREGQNTRSDNFVAPLFPVSLCCLLATANFFIFGFKA
jgi:hypothetical protein